MRRLGLALAALVGLGALSTAIAQSTTRIETRPFYGAVVTVEKGVRVYRPLPPHDRVIINPNNTPVYIGINEYSYSGPGVINQNLNANNMNDGLRGRGFVRGGQGFGVHRGIHGRGQGHGHGHVPGFGQGPSRR